MELYKKRMYVNKQIHNVFVSRYSAWTYQTHIKKCITANHCVIQNRQAFTRCFLPYRTIFF